MNDCNIANTLAAVAPLSSLLADPTTPISVGKASAGLAPLLRFAGPVLAEQIGHFIVKELLATMKKDGQAFAHEFVEAADAAADGVTVTFTLSRIGPVFDVLSANVLERVKSLAKFQSAGISGSMTVAVKAGFHRG